MRRAGELAGRAAGMALLPLSILPILLLTPQILRAPELYLRRHVLPVLIGPPRVDRSALPPPNVALTPAQKARFAPFATHETIPVVAFHGVNDRNDRYSVSQESLALQLQMLARAGFRTISMAQYVRFLHGDSRGLPGRPILLTFDDGRIDTWRGADRILERYGMRATLFVIAGQAQQAHPFYMSWKELRGAASSRRWDIQEHAGWGHEQVRITASGLRAPFYGNRRYANGHIESLARWRTRVTRDIRWARQAMTANLPGHPPRAFALPFGDYGQQQSNDPRIAGKLRRLLASRFDAVFIVNPPRYVAKGRGSQPVGRFEVHTHTTPERLYRSLRAKAPRGGR